METPLECHLDPFALMLSPGRQATVRIFGKYSRGTLVNLGFGTASSPATECESPRGGCKGLHLQEPRGVRHEDGEWAAGSLGQKGRGRGARRLVSVVVPPLSVFTRTARDVTSIRPSKIQTPAVLCLFASGTDPPLTLRAGFLSLVFFRSVLPGNVHTPA